MQARRIVLILAIALLVTAAAASFGSLAPPPTEEPAPESEGEQAPEAPARAARDAVTVAFDGRTPPSTETVSLGRHVVVTVRAASPGQVEIEGLGRVEQVAALAPASIDVFTDTEGVFDVVYEPVEGPSRRLGTLVVTERDGGRGTRPARDRRRQNADS